MVQSINTNSGAFNALQKLNQTTKSVGNTNNRISTGLKINSPKDDAATLAIAQRLLGDIGGAGAVKSGLNFAQSSVGVAEVGAQAVSDLLIEMKSVAVQANQEGLDATSREALNAEFNSLRDQAGSIVESASFNGTNLIKAGSGNLDVLKDDNGNRMTVVAQDFSAGGLGIDTLSLDSVANSQTALTAIDSAISTASAQQASLGSSANQIDNQAKFTTQLQDILKEGVGNLIDADLGAESANLQAQQVKQKLGVQSLSIANSGPQHILNLFQGN
ncbi:MAG: flagellin [Alphaproteobacteria bacterium]|jgi:flagellin|nr:flagellin [Alphaproteobacteria bacterium]MBT4086802.1 flagellin [Alphaproteobacteria bacterium]MBT4546649.1 flagellin [Alphaproteobacteria bacterium]MBT7743695.1 flagellin [Alphaproteobacteria bacterium]